jgi:ubiquinone/menaquinone biosynthesis C-methylase UbiE
MIALWILLSLIAAFVVISIVWRWASRVWSIPFPSFLSWMLDSAIVQRFNKAQTIVERLHLRPGQRILELGPGPGRILIPAAKRILPGGEAVGVDLQQKMLDRLGTRAKKEGVANLTLIQGDAVNPHVPEESFDLVYLCTVLGEIPNRSAALTQCYRALKPGGVLSITEQFGDPHYQSRPTVRRLAEAAGFRPRSVVGSYWFFTADFTRP